MRLLERETEKMFMEEQVAKDFFTEVCNADLWVQCYTKELVAVPIDNAPILMADIRSRMNIDSSVSDETMLECMEDNNIGILIPMGNGYRAYPLRYTGFVPAVQRAGYQNSPVILCMSDKQAQKQMSPADKAIVLNMGYSCYKNKVIVLIRDEMISFIGSGDETDYSVLRMDQLNDAFYNALVAQFADAKFNIATASHEYFTMSYTIKDDTLEKEIRDTLSTAGLNAKTLLPGVKLVTSDVGISGANLYPYMLVDGVMRMLGKPIVLTHKNKHTIKDFEQNCSKLMAMFKEASDKLQIMSNTTVNHAEGCLLRICKQVGLPKKLSCEAAETFAIAYPYPVQIDVYWELYNILDTYDFEKGGLSESQKIGIQENIARIMFSNMDEYDIPFQWE